MNETSNRIRRLGWLRWLAVPLAAALLFTACGDDDAEPAAPAPAPAEEPEPAPEPRAGPRARARRGA